MPSVSPALRKEFAQLSKTANARIKSLKKGRYRSPAVEKLKESGIKKFGVRAQKLETEADFRKYLSPEYVVRTRVGVGSPAPESTAKGLEKTRKALDADRAWVKEARSKLARASSELDRRFEALLK